MNGYGPLVSVVVPNYNHAQYLHQRIQSILNQTYKNIELILLDDASTDDSLDILKQYAQTLPRTRLIVNARNSGSPFAQWNKGVEMAQGPLVWIAESDDSAQPELLETLVQKLQSYPSAVLAFCQSNFMDETDQILYSYNENYRYIYKSERWSTDFFDSGTEECRHYMMLHNSIPNASAVLFQKWAYQKTGGPPIHFKLNGDWLFYCQIFLHGDLAYSARPLNHFRKHTQTQRHRANANAMAYFEIIELARFINENHHPPRETYLKAQQNFCNWWIGSLFRQKLSLNYFLHNHRLYRHFKACRSHLAIRILYNALWVLGLYLINLLHLKPPLKRLRKWLFPGKYFEH